MLKGFAMITLFIFLLFVTACVTNPQATPPTPSWSTSFKAELAIDLESAKDSLTENERPALDVLEQNLTALVQHDHSQYRSGFVDEQLADALDFYYNEQFHYRFSSIESIEKHPSIKNQLHITVLGERLDTTTHSSVEDIKMMYAIRQSEQGDWAIYTID